MSRKLIVTIDVGTAMDWTHITQPRLYDYAKKIGAGLWFITGSVFEDLWDETNQCAAHPSFWKIPLVKWFAKQELYDQMLFIDSDVFIPKTSGNIFEALPEPGAYFAEDMGADDNYLPWREWAKKHYPDFDIPSDWVYRNNGIFLMDKVSAEVIAGAYNQLDKLHARWIEQCAANVALATSGVVKMLPSIWNFPCPFKTLEFPHNAWLHACGCSNVDRRLWFERMIEAEKLGRHKLRKL